MCRQIHDGPFEEGMLLAAAAMKGCLLRSRDFRPVGIRTRQHRDSSVFDSTFRGTLHIVTSGDNV